MDSAFDSHAVVSTCVRAGVRFSITTRQTRPVQAAIEAIDPQGWVPIAYPHAIHDEDSGQWISDAEITETTYTASQSRRQSEQITVRLIIRRVRDKNVAPDQGELFTAWRYHAFITDSTLQIMQTEKQHREHAINEQVNADLKDSTLAHMPSGSFAANAAWLALAAIAHNLTRATGCLASLFHTTARTGTLRQHLITLPARIARRSRRITLRLPLDWPHRHAFTSLFTTTHAKSGSAIMAGGRCRACRPGARSRGVHQVAAPGRTRRWLGRPAPTSSPRRPANPGRSSRVNPAGMSGQLLSRPP